MPNYRTCPKEYIEKLQVLRYSLKTIRTYSYSSLFEEFINYFHHEDYRALTEKDILEFMRYLVEERQVGTSYQNQAAPRWPSMPSSAPRRILL
ncbi:phage integrase N-terminal SAM-like domain-containing protein [Catalinimonas alkaloidigena]|uniref:phage integrase N-terminal SAM-like domain-containing protein n=1 Tax=Catalinimonas alkaloidigena TaxID=1075417 RepID=UPI003977A8C1